MPSASYTHCGETDLRSDPGFPGPTDCRGGQGQRRRTQARGPRRGGVRARPHQGRAAPISERLDRISLSADSAERPAKAKAEVCPGRRTESNELDPGWEGDPERRTQASPDVQPVHKSTLEAECPKAAADSGRRRGPRRSGPGPARYHWDWRASRSRGGGPHRGHGRGLQQKVVERERGREEVL